MKVGIVGVSGYSGLTALELLLKHPQVRITYLSAGTTTGPIGEIWPQLNGLIDLNCEALDLKKAADLCDVIFLAVPHTTSMTIAPELLKAKKKVIDLSGDYRLKDAAIFKKWYGEDHKDSHNLSNAVYGLPEFYREDIKKAQLIANPGCYPTAAILALAPVLTSLSNQVSSIIIDAKSGVSGAGRKVMLNFLFSEVDENFKAYKVLNHQHAPEINLYLSKVSNKPIEVNFVPHLLPINRGILETIYLQFDSKQNLDMIHEIYKKFYKTEPFVRVLKPGAQPELRNVNHTNFCDIGLTLSPDQKLLVITSVIDNLIKGAAGQAVQNFNIMCGFKETLSLI